MGIRYIPFCKALPGVHVHHNDGYTALFPFEEGGAN